MPIWLAKMVATRIIKAVKHKIDLKRIDKYVNKPNELDKQFKSLQKSVNKYGKYIEEIEKDIAEIKSISHKPINGLKDRLKKLEKKAKF